MDKEQYKELINMLALVSRLLAVNITGLLTDTQKEKILMLNRIGMSNTDIASVLNTTNNNVSVTLSQAKKDK